MKHTDWVDDHSDPIERLDVPTMTVLDRGLAQPIGFVHFPEQAKENPRSDPGASYREKESA